jgi:hypothetical protein
MVILRSALPLHLFLDVGDFYMMLDIPDLIFIGFLSDFLDNRTNRMRACGEIGKIIPGWKICPLDLKYLL